MYLSQVLALCLQVVGMELVSRTVRRVKKKDAVLPAVEAMFGEITSVCLIMMPMKPW